MTRIVYAIRGFDCASCAEKSERHLAEHPSVSSARIDFLNERLYLNLKEGTLTPEEVEAIIAEVEDDEVEVSPLGEEKESILDKDFWILLGRILYCVAVFFVCGFAFKDLYWVRFSLYLSALIVIGYDLVVKVIKNLIKRRNPLDEYLLMSVASIGAFVLAATKYASLGEATSFSSGPFLFEEHYEAVLVCLLWQVGELLQDIAVKKGRSAILKATSAQSETALLRVDGGTERVDAKSLKVDDIVIVSHGGRIPVDGVVLFGSGYADLSSLTGESMPIYLKEGDRVYSGSLLTNGQIEVRATKDHASSTSERILELVTSSLEHKGEAEKAITKFARVYTPIVFLVAVAYLLIAGFAGPSWRSAIFTSLEILVISCPCAIVISVPLAYFASVGLAGKNGIIVKGAAHLDTIARVNTLVTDKTGTLTTGVFALKERHLEEGVKEEEFVSYLVALENLSSHPLARTIVSLLPHGALPEVTRYAIALEGGVIGEVDGITIAAGTSALMKAQGIEVNPTHSGVYVYVGKGNRLLGYVRLDDETREGMAKMVATLEKQGTSLTLLSGDNTNRVQAFANELGIKDARGGLLPQDKLSVLKGLKADGTTTVAYMGDGVNDAPCLALADVGIAMGGLGADMALEKADIVILNDDPRQFVRLRKIARICRTTIGVNLIVALAAKATVMALAMILGEGMPMEVAVAADTGLSVLLSLNSLLLFLRRP